MIGLYAEKVSCPDMCCIPVFNFVDVNKKHLLLETDTTVKAIPFQVIQEAEVDD